MLSHPFFIGLVIIVEEPDLLAAYFDDPLMMSHADDVASAEEAHR